jgi:hypothetical protein
LGFQNTHVPGELLSLALTVDRHADGDYFWAILESFDHSNEFECLMEAATGFSTYLAALKAGYVALVALSEDPDSGPLDLSS